MKYEKPWLSLKDQIELLRSRGLVVTDIKDVEHFLSNVSYYRLSGYFEPFMVQRDCFEKDTNFNNIKRLYTFDRELKLLVFDNIERLEVSIRTKLVNYLSEKYGPFFMHNESIFKPTKPTGNLNGIFISKGFYLDLQASIQRKLNEKHPEVFIKAFKNKYTSEPFPPAWMSIEVLTMGELSKLFSNLNLEEDKATIAKYFNLPIPVFDSWLHSLSYVRNLCGHHSRLWNRDLAIDPKKLIEKQGRNKKKWLDGARVDNRRTFYTLCILKFFLDQIIPSNSFREKFEDLIAKYPDVPVKFLGMPFDSNGDRINWESLPVWN